MKSLLSIFILFILVSCDFAQEAKSISIQYKIEFMKGEDYKCAIGIDNPFNIICDSNYYAIPFYKDEELSYMMDWYSLRPKDTVAEVVLKFYDSQTDSLIYIDSVLFKVNKLPNPYLLLLPCDSMCSSLKNIKNIETIWPQLYYYGLDIRCRVMQCSVSIIRENEIIVTEDYEEFKIDENFKKLVGKLRVGDRLKFSKLNGIRMPDGTIRSIENKEIFIEE